MQGERRLSEASRRSDEYSAVDGVNGMAAGAGRGRGRGSGDGRRQRRDRSSAGGGALPSLLAVLRSHTSGLCGNLSAFYRPVGAQSRTLLNTNSVFCDGWCPCCSQSRAYSRF